MSKIYYVVACNYPWAFILTGESEETFGKAEGTSLARVSSPALCCELHLWRCDVFILHFLKGAFSDISYKGHCISRLLDLSLIFIF